MRVPGRGILLALAFLLACGGPSEERPAAAPADSAPAETYRVVVRAAGLRIDPRPDAAVVRDVPAGSALRLVRDTLANGERWVRLATWDDRQGWAAADEVMETTLWAHYQRALGRPASTLRPAYPVGGGRWGAEAPVPSADYMDDKEVWLIAGDATVGTRVATREEFLDACRNGLHRIAILEAGPGTPPGAEPDPARAILAVPSEGQPTVEPWPVGEPAPAPAGSAARLAVVVGAAPGAEPAAVWRPLGEDAGWLALAWDDPDAGPHAAAWVLARGADEPGGTPVADGWRAWPVVRSAPADAAGGPPDDLALALGTPGSPRPTILVVVSREEGAVRADVWLAGPERYQRVRRGYAWGC